MRCDNSTAAFGGSLRNAASSDASWGFSRISIAMSTVYGLPEVTGNEKSRSVPQSGPWSGDVPGGGRLRVSVDYCVAKKVLPNED